MEIFFLRRGNVAKTLTLLALIVLLGCLGLQVHRNKLIIAEMESRNKQLYTNSAVTTELNGTYKQTFFGKHNSRQTQKYRNYLDVYETYFRRFVGQHANTLEIGINDGGSLQVMSAYMKNANVYGVDILTSSCKNLGGHITTYCFNIKDVNKTEEYFKDVMFDIIIDDASHISRDVIHTFKTLFQQRLKPRGVFLVEDLHTAYWDSYLAGYLDPRSQNEYFKQFVDFLNDQFIDNTQYKVNLTDSDRYMVDWIESIAFFDSLAVIVKRPQVNDRKFTLQQAPKGIF